MVRKYSHKLEMKDPPQYSLINSLNMVFSCVNRWSTMDFQLMKADGNSPTVISDRLLKNAACFINDTSLHFPTRNLIHIILQICYIHIINYRIFKIFTGGASAEYSSTR